MSWTSIVGIVPGFVAYQFFLVKSFNSAGRRLTFSLFVIYLWIATINDESCISSSRAAFPPKTKEYRVACVRVLIMVLLAHRALGS